MSMQPAYQPVRFRFQGKNYEWNPLQLLAEGRSPSIGLVGAPSDLEAVRIDIPTFLMFNTVKLLVWTRYLDSTTKKAKRDCDIGYWLHELDGWESSKDIFCFVFAPGPKLPLQAKRHLTMIKPV